MQHAQSPAFKLTRNFSGITYFQTKQIPPDTMGAVNEKYLVSFVNNGFAIFDKTGKRLQFKSGDQFWKPLGTKKGQPAFDQFDPKVLYDAFTRRFIVVYVSGEKDKDRPGSWLLLAISGKDNPFKWKHWAIEAEKNSTNWADYPSLGIDQSNIYITANMFSGKGKDEYQRTKIWVIPKKQLISGVTRLKPSAVFNGPKGSTFTTQPTYVIGSNINEHYFIGGATTNTLKLSKITFSGKKPEWKFITSLKIPSLSSTELPQAPQKGVKAKIDTGDPRLINAVFRNGLIYTVHTVPSKDKKRTEIAWYQIDPKKKKVVQQGRIKHPVRFYYYPSIAVNQKGDVVVGFSGSSKNQYVSAYFTGRKSSDPPGKMRRVSLLKKGNASYTRKDGDTKIRWGDYSATVAEPNGDRFWTLQEYVLRKNIYGTWWGNIAVI